MQAEAVHQLRKRLYRTLFLAWDSPCLSHRHYSYSTSTSHLLSDLLLSSPVRHSTTKRSANTWLRGRNLLGSPWSAFFYRELKVGGSGLRAGNVIEKKDRIYEVLKVDHSHEGRGKATIKVELRDIDSGNKVTQRLGVFVETKTYIYMCTERDGKVLLMDPDTLDQLEVTEDFFGKNAKFLQDDMKVKVEIYNGIPLSASIPKHVTCIVKEAQPPMKGIAATPKDKMAVLENGLTVKVPPHILVGEAVVIDTEDDSYVRRCYHVIWREKFVYNRKEKPERRKGEGVIRGIGSNLRDGTLFRHNVP
ncbi:hypothetical protein FNV43_RR14085 [Rhamnella rubrinervis]|uniref:Elongation factor P n=1 Tax=Rhamnella rubrinervis TaxID=2594499 RepID=A0A8K0H2E3_9ROSA|nr:hypothetical protein FNV43_RR14085 [Rhamnella rubrinervis]